MACTNSRCEQSAVCLLTGLFSSPLGSVVTSYLAASFRQQQFTLKYLVSHQVRLSEILRSAHTVYLCVLCGSENKLRLFPYIVLTDWLL
jgi:hypothetical protein